MNTKRAVQEKYRIICIEFQPCFIKSYASCRTVQIVAVCAPIKYPQAIIIYNVEAQLKVVKGLQSAPTSKNWFCSPKPTPVPTFGRLRAATCSKTMKCLCRCHIQYYVLMTSRLQGNRRMFDKGILKGRGPS